MTKCTWQWMCAQPKSASRGGGIDTSLVPPGGFIPRAMDLAMVTAAERNRELVAHFAADCR
jgi:hypothetical protein